MIIIAIKANNTNTKKPITTTISTSSNTLTHMAKYISTFV